MPTIHVGLTGDGDDSESLADGDLDGGRVDDEDLDARYHGIMEDRTEFRSRWALDAAHGLLDTVVVGDRAYEVRVYTPGLDDEWSDLWGFQSDEPPMLCVATEAPNQRETLLHEVLHAVDSAAGTDAGERVVSTWAPILLEVLRKNPELATMLLASDAPATAE